MPKLVTILAIESSCDETAASVLVGDASSRQPKFTIKSSVVKSQIALHRKYGGVVPEIAAREHVAHIEPVVRKALEDAGLNLSRRPLGDTLSSSGESKKSHPSPNEERGRGEVDYIAVTAGPGLVPALVVGVEFAKTLSHTLKIPLMKINHMEGHLFSSFGTQVKSVKSKVESRSTKISFPMISLVVSGGHTMIVLQNAETKYKVIGSTVDDAAGEAFDKVAKLLGLPYPGGPEISKLADSVTSTPIIFPRPMLNQKNFDFSFSGLKTAVLNYVKNQKLKVESQKLKEEVAKAFQDAVVDVLVKKTLRAADKHKAKTIALTGGVAANKELRRMLHVSCSKLHVNFIVPPFSLCTDNAGMIAIAAYLKIKNGAKTTPLSKIKADPNWEIK